jgi:hypothetical protein
VNIVLYFKLAVAAVLIANIVIQAFRLINSHGEEQYITRGRKRLFASFIGASIVVIADIIVEAVTIGNINPVVSQVNGLASFIEAFFGIGCVTAIIIGGMMIMLSGNESLKTRGQTIIKVSIVALIVVLVSGSIIMLVINAANH